MGCLVLFTTDPCTTSKYIYGSNPTTPTKTEPGLKVLDHPYLSTTQESNPYLPGWITAYKWDPDPQVPLVGGIEDSMEDPN